MHLWIATQEAPKRSALERFPQPASLGIVVSFAESGVSVRASQAPAAPDLDVSCFSYTAATRVLRLDRYPPWNEGSEIHAEETSIAGDGPLVAGFCSGLGLKAGLETNNVGADSEGDAIADFLARHRIAHNATRTAKRTPRALILTHPDGAREWLVDLQDARADLAACDGKVLTRGRAAYVDCFTSIAEGTIRALELVRRHGRMLHANIGGSAMSEELQAAVQAAAPDVLQASVTEDEAPAAVEVARDLATRFRSPLVFVTLGAFGAVALERDVVHVEPARRLEGAHSHGAGAAFSAGAIFGHRRGWPVNRILALACAAGSMQCSDRRSESPTRAAVSAFASATLPGPSLAVERGAQ